MGKMEMGDGWYIYGKMKHQSKAHQCKGKGGML